MYFLWLNKQRTTGPVDPVLHSFHLESAHHLSNSLVQLCNQ